ncbi:MAG: ABC transporter permease [Bacteroidales bacterium]|nr:ABC transporter permease [Bacteroidales bacterium]MBN2758264.1 ABC transporter permease [Bacteroidales bacterium]
MNRFIGFLKKEFYHIFRDKRSLVILFGMPVAQVLLFGFVITNEIKNVKIAILDNSKDYITKELTDKLISTDYFILDKNLKSANEIEGIFKAGHVKEVIIFESNFAKNLEKESKANMQIITDATDPNTANLLVNYTSAIVMDYVNSINNNYKLPLQINTETRMFYNPELASVFMFVPGIMAMILMLISAIMTSITITREKETGTMEILLVSPLKPAQIIIGKVTPYVILSFVNAVIIILLGMFVFKMPVQGNIALLLFENVLFILLALSLGILISTMRNDQQSAMMISMFALLLPTILLSGFIFPIENMPWILQLFAQLMPPKWFIIIIKNIMLKGTSFAFVWKETLILAGFTVFFLALSIKKFKVRLE